MCLKNFLADQMGLVDHVALWMLPEIHIYGLGLPVFLALERSFLTPWQKDIPNAVRDAEVLM